MRFIFNFVFFGLLFFLIYRFLPDTFETLVSWADKIFDILRDLVMMAVEKVNALKNNTGNP